ncbi:MAG: hypothetical protein JWN25_1066, partial [Verrucomicrobiales bacterium]|nr:hypothetical protein [Verrucomicrobiales bacterium]
MLSRSSQKKRLLALVLALSTAPLFAAENEPTFPAGTSDDINAAMKRFQLESGLKVDLFAAEPMLQNIVSFTFDNRGNSYVVETHRRRTSVFDVRNLQPWLEDDLSFTSVDDRANFYKKHLSGSDPAFLNAVGKGFEDFNHDGKRDWHDLEVESERIRKVEVKEGKAIATTTYTDGYQTLISGVAAGVLTRGSNVWFTCIPDLWLLSGTNNSGQAASKKILHHGFGVHIAFGGHDMHGLKFGPDGRIYWSIADRGTHVEENGKVLIDLPHMGAVFRSEPDGSNLEVVASGLRNPQELVFDDFGNLFAGDNNADGGDKARIVYVMSGSDSGWRIGWQWLPKLGAWNSEGLWYGVETNSSPAILPPVAWVGRGPAGFAYYPGTGLSARYKNHFFMADFPDGVRTFTLKPVGAGFTIGEDRRLMGGICATDVEFSPWDGIYVSDWVQGWDKTGKGRIYKVYSPDADKTGQEEVRRLLAQDWTAQKTPALINFLGHFDQRIRQEAQFELASRGGTVKSILAESAEDAKLPQLVRIHCLWALAQIARKEGGMEKSNVIQTLLDDSDGEIRAQAAKQAGELNQEDTFGQLIKLLGDSSPRARSMAAISLGQLKNPQAVPALLTATKNNNNQDPYLRHALVMGLTSCA